MTPTFWSAVGWLAGAVGIGALIASYFSETVRHLLPTPRRLARWLKHESIAPPAEEHFFAVLVADLKRDTDGSQTDHVAAALAPYRGIDVVRCGPGPEWEFGSRNRLEMQARQLLDARGGDILVFGEVAKADERLRLYVLGQHSGAESQYGTYALEKAELPTDFGADFDVVLLAAVTARVAPATERAGTYLVDLLLPTAEKLQRLCAAMPAGLDADQRGTLWHALGFAANILGEQSGQSARLEEAVAAYRAALKERTRERVPLDWAMTQNNLGKALWRLGERESGTARLEEAVAACRAALEEYTRERAPLEWAMTQNNLGNVLQTLGDRESGTARLEEAVAAYRAALEEWTRERVPLDWAMTQNNLGAALQTLGVRESDTARLEEAVAVFRAALEEYTRERAPLDWAMTQNNLGNALWRLGERESGTAQLEKAVAAYRAALEEYTRKRVPLDWAMTQNNLGSALCRLGERESGTARLEEAVAACKAALETFEAGQSSHYKSVVERNLEDIRRVLDERRSGMRSKTSD